MNLTFPFVAMLLLTACGAGDGTGLDASGRPITEAGDQPSDPDPDIPPDPEDPEGLQPDLASIQQHVLGPICATCHSGANAPLGLRMDSLEQSSNNLIEVPSVTNPALNRVEHGEPMTSVLYLKIIGDPSVGAPMPLGQPPLPQDTIDIIGQWIEEGAVIEPDATNFAVTASKASRKGNLLSLELTFNMGLDPASLEQNQLLVRWQLDDSSGWLDNRRLRLFSPFANRLLIELDLDGVTADSLSIQLNHPDLSSMVSHSGHLLDGNGNQREGGVFTHVYHL